MGWIGLGWEGGEVYRSLFFYYARLTTTTLLLLLLLLLLPSLLFIFFLLLLFTTTGNGNCLFCLGEMGWVVLWNGWDLIVGVRVVWWGSFVWVGGWDEEIGVDGGMKKE
jgi:hypothetical protein